jgi:hypothetical protein
MNMEESGWIKVDDLKPHPKNPRDHTEEQVKEIAKSIKAHGWGRPIIISSDYYILAGEGAYLAATEELHLLSVPYKFLEPKRKHDEPEAISYMLADNKLGEKSDWNYGKLETNFKDLKVAGFDVTLTGFEDVEVKELQVGLNFGGDVDLNDKEPLPKPKLPKEENHVGIVKCPKCGEEFEPNN